MPTSKHVRAAAGGAWADVTIGGSTRSANSSGADGFGLLEVLTPLYVKNLPQAARVTAWRVRKSCMPEITDVDQEG